ncbi:hypothetical protein [Aurantiacibacter gangjinensis]|uniref:hypothetical protein n=1 Tax=Aurantiacibacter gangjinensis TaxID=502682 RepID=UPI00069AB589|nr:hypothetical protein [Aurantiacibacter gangjinensis]APE27724.1 hypothetical protein BMF35_a0895 [Aurantiacibacter gangjinensis]
MTRVARIVWVVAFLIGAFTHARDIVMGGWLPYDFAPFLLNWFWTLLLPLDLLAAGLIAFRKRIGVLLGVAIMLADVGVNTWYAHATQWPALFAALQWQSMFLGFVIGTAPLLWHSNASKTVRL